MKKSLVNEYLLGFHLLMRAIAFASRLKHFPVTYDIDALPVGP